MLHMKVCPYSYFWWCGYPWGPWVSFIITYESSVRVTKIISRIGASSVPSISFHFSPLFKLMKWTYQKHVNCKSQNSLKLSFTNICGPCSNLLGCESFLESFLSWHSCSMWDKLWKLNRFWWFSVRGYLYLIKQDSATHINGLAVYLKDGLLSVKDRLILRRLSGFLCFWLALRHFASHFFFLYGLYSPFLCSFWCYFI